MIFNMFMKKIRKISIRGRFAIALRGCELLVEKKELSNEEYSDFFQAAWEYTSTDAFDEWEASVGEYCDKDFGDTDLTRIIYRSLDIACFHLYGVIDEHGEMQIAYALWDILDILHGYGIVLEDVEKVRRFSPFGSIRELVLWMEFGYGRPFGRDEIVPLIEYNSNFSVRDLIDMRPS